MKKCKVQYHDRIHEYECSSHQTLLSVYISQFNKKKQTPERNRNLTKIPSLLWLHFLPLFFLLLLFCIFLHHHRLHKCTYWIYDIVLMKWEEKVPIKFEMNCGLLFYLRLSRTNMTDSDEADFNWDNFYDIEKNNR